jgi:hypothetical protein
MSFWKHLPVKSERDTTENFEQLQPILEELKNKIAALESKIGK